MGYPPRGLTRLELLGRYLSLLLFLVLTEVLRAFLPLLSLTAVLELRSH